MKNKKTNQIIKIENPEILKDCEWCFQFDDDEPKIFAYTNENNDTKEKSFTITLTNRKNDSFLIFDNNGKKFKIFARELSEEGKEMRRLKKITID